MRAVDRSDRPKLLVFCVQQFTIIAKFCSSFVAVRCKYIRPWRFCVNFLVGSESDLLTRVNGPIVWWFSWYFIVELDQSHLFRVLCSWNVPSIELLSDRFRGNRAKEVVTYRIRMRPQLLRSNSLTNKCTSHRNIVIQYVANTQCVAVNERDSCDWCGIYVLRCVLRQTQRCIFDSSFVCMQFIT